MDNSARFSNIYENNRFAYVDGLLSLSAWQDLSKEVEAFRPDFVISAARKMPRLIDLLRGEPYNLFRFPATFVSDAAIGFIKADIAGSRVAILDDALNVGSTMTDIWERVYQPQHLPAKVTCFYLAANAGGGQALHKKMDVRRIRENFKTKHDYKSAATRNAMSLWAINRPLDIEFPIFSTKEIDFNAIDRFEDELAGMIEDGIAYRLDIAEAQDLGLHRYVVCVEPQNSLNEKVRIYIDHFRKELVIAPMAYSYVPHDTPCGRIEHRFMSSASLGEAFLKRFSYLPELQISKTEAQQVFGPGRAERMMDSKEWLKTNVASATPATDEFHDGDWVGIKPLMKIRDARILNDCLEAFFVASADYYKAEEGVDYGRLRKGPTFHELKRALEEVWEGTADMPGGEISPVRLSALVDEHIDHGFIVPMTSSGGQRIFRKGEPYPYRRIDLEIIKLICGYADPSENIRDFIERLPPNKQSRMTQLWLGIDGARA